MKSHYVFSALLSVSCSYASKNAFSVNDDVLAFPQYQIVFSDTYITAERAKTILQAESLQQEAGKNTEDESIGQLTRLQYQDDRPSSANAEDPIVDRQYYERLILRGRPYMCAIPHVERTYENKSEEKVSPETKENELARAAHRGWELLHDMEGKPCLFYSTGWWSYSFCFNSQVKQFHSLSPGTNGAPLWPPTEDPTTPSYILGKTDKESVAKASTTESAYNGHEVAELQTTAETSYLVQRLTGGTPCDLTGKPRKIEVQFHCNPQSTDRIGWIKETATCSYLMVVYTPRLCNDVAFLPPKETRAYTISCREILKSEDIPEWEARKASEASHKMIDVGSGPRIIVGNVVVGAMKDVGKDGQKIERGKVVLTQEEKADVVAIQKDGHVQTLSRAGLKKLELNPEDVDAFRKELEKLAGSKDWKIERLDDADGHIQLRGVVASNSGDEKYEKKIDEPRSESKEDTEAEKGDDTEEGSVEEFKDNV